MKQKFKKIQKKLMLTNEHVLPLKRGNLTMIPLKITKGSLTVVASVIHFLKAISTI
jgi:hypothetical protein